MTCNKCGYISALLANPFYVHECDALDEDHARHIIVHQYTGCLRVSNEWAVPTGDSMVTLSVPALIDVLVGSCIWNPDYGKFKIVSFDQEGQKIKVQVHDDNDVEAGTVIGACTKFILTDDS